MSDAITDPNLSRRRKSAGEDEPRSEIVSVDGHCYQVDPMSERFTDLLMECFVAGKKKALAKARERKGPKKANRASSKRTVPGLGIKNLRASKRPAALASLASKMLRKKTKPAFKDV